MNNHNIKIWLSLFFIFLLSQLIYAGNIPYRFVHIETKNGLPHNFVFSVVQDKKGFIWIGTNNGLARYDGYNFRVFQPDPTKQSSIRKKPVNEVYIDFRGNLWIWAQGMGISKMNIETEQFTYYSQDNTNPNKISGNFFKKFFEDKDSNLWIASNKGLNLYNPKKDLFTRVYPKTNDENASLGSAILNIKDDAYGYIWFLTTKGIGRLDRKTFEVTSLGAIISMPLIDHVSISDIIADNKGNLWFSTESNGLYCYNITTKKLTNYFNHVKCIHKIYMDKQGNLYLYTNNPLNHLLFADKLSLYTGSLKSFQLSNDFGILKNFKFTEDKSGNVWISSNLGLEMFNPVNGLTHYRSNTFDPGSIAGNDIQSIFLDNSENLWVCIYRNGISKADLKQNPFHRYFFDPTANGKCIAGNQVASVYEDSHHNLWIGCYGDGLTRYNPSNDSYLTIPISKSDPDKLNINAPFAICEDSKGFLWLGIDNGQLDKIDPRTLKFTHYSSKLPMNSPCYFKGTSVRKILPDKSGNLWLACDSGIIEFEQKTEKFIYHSVLYEKDFISNFFYRTLYIDKEGIIWAGSNNGGLIRYDKSLKQFTHFLNDPKNINSISGNTVYAIYEDKEAYLWVGTSAGLNRFDRKKESFVRIKVDKKFNETSIYSIAPDSLGNFWMSTDHGLAKLNLKTLTCKYYLENDGLPCNEFITTSQCVTGKGEIFLGSSKGLVSFFPGAIEENPYNAKPVITNLLIFNKSMAPGDSLNKRILLDKQICSSRKILLHYNENDFTIEFSALHFAAPEKINYVYKLDGFNEFWINADANHRWANYTGLPPGHYTFRLKATNNDGMLCLPSDEIALEIIITPPFWKTLWFKIIAILLITSLAILYFWIQLYQLRKRNELLEQKVKERTSDLEEATVILEERQEEINLQKEEIEAQYDALAETNIELTKQKEQIIEQNKELGQHRNNLQLLVNERTRELEQALYKAEESDRLKSSFLANMSHEIRTPMNAIIGFSLMLRQKDFSEDDRNEFIKIIINSGESLLVLINDILDLSKIQANQLVLFPVSVDLFAVLAELNEVYTVEASKKNISIKLIKDKVSKDFTLYADIVRLKQVMGNLIANAIKFTHNGEVEFGVKNINENITFYVKDTGIGIPKETGNAIFERFLKLENAKEELLSGVGLGLTICKSLVEQWGGRIWYESKENIGTTFYFTHPVSNITTSLSEYEIINSEIPDLKDKVILIAEDEELNFKLLKAYLSETHAAIAWAKNGQEAVAYLQQNHIDIVLMDIKMPVLGGIEATRLIKQIQPELPVIAQTAFAYEEEIGSFLKAGVDGYISKPIKPGELMQILKKYL